jgi:hypothetical protein
VDNERCAVEDLEDERREALVLGSGLELFLGDQPVVDVFDLLALLGSHSSAGWGFPHITIARWPRRGAWI